MSYVLDSILNTHWAISEDHLRVLISIAERQPDFELLEKIRSEKPKETERASIRGGVAVIPVRGPLFKRANLMTEHCGATSYETVLRDFHQMMASEKVQGIVFDIDSPGGQANGCSELADHIHAARGQKPIAAYIGGTGASAAYWLASACDRVFASDSAIVGSIGVQTALKSEKVEGEIRIVSSQSPAKNRDPSTEEGQRDVQTVVDALAEVFLAKVARNRRVDRDHVLERFGQGAVFVGQEAIKRGLVDEISTLECVISQYGENPLKTEPITASFIAEYHPDIASLFRAEGEKAALQKIEADEKRKSTILTLGKSQVSEEFLSDLIKKGTSVEEAALAILQEAQRGGHEKARKDIDASLEGLNIPPVQQSSSDTKGTLDAQLESALSLSQRFDGTKIRGRA